MQTSIIILPKLKRIDVLQAASTSDCRRQVPNFWKALLPEARCDLDLVDKQ